MTTLCVFVNFNCYCNLQSSSIIVTTADPGIPTVPPVGSEDESIVSIKFSLPSNIISLFIGISNGTLVIPAGNVTVYGPEV